MKTVNHKKAKILTLIPAIVFAIVTICLGSLMISYLSTGSDVTAMILITATSMSLIFTTVPCLVMSVFGTVFAVRAKNEGISGSHGFFVLGLIEIAVYGMGVLLTIIAVLFTFFAIRI